ncbi:MAG: S8 family serine peptidase [Planctomycetes bacterium]|nr:S8 family serine peptidase [Planctomycetota bacterium]
MTKLNLALALSSFAAALGAQSAPDQVARTERWVYRPATPIRVDPTSPIADRVTLKFRDSLRVRLAGGELSDRDGADLRAVNGALRGATVARLFTRSTDELDAERERVARNLAAGEAPLADLNNWFAVRTTGAAATERLVEALLAEPHVETAYAEFAVAKTSDIPPPTPLLESSQGYLGAPPAGYAYDAVQTIVGARGQGLYLAQLEGKHTLDHEDVTSVTAATILGVPASANWNSWQQHGTACLGIMGAQRNAYGMRGMASDHAAFYTSSLENGAPNMVSLATAALRAGDVMSSSYAWVVSGLHAPADWDQATYDAIRIAAASGIVYTIAAGNTNHDLADTTIYGNRYLPASTPSGAFITGASGPGDSSRAGFSNFGAVVVANCWGSGVATTGYGSAFDPGDVRQQYTYGFSGTSSATPALAGVIGSLCGAIQEQLGRTPTLAELRGALLSTGTPIPGNGGRIGTRPDLVQLFAAFGLPDGLAVTQDAVLGGTATLAAGGPVGAPHGLLLAFSTGSTGFGANRPLLLDVANLIVAGSAVLDGSGSAQYAFAVPADPSLLGAELFFQGVQIRGGALHLSNSVMLWIH